MGDWNNPVIIPAPQHRPSPWESTILPAITQTFSNLALHNVAQQAKVKEVALANKRQDEQKIAELVGSGGWQPASPWDPPEGTFDIGGKRLKMAPISLEPFTGPDKKVVKGQYYVKGGGMTPQLVTIAPGWEGPFTSIGEGDRSGLPKDFVYQMKDGQTDILFDPTKNKPTIGELKGEVFAGLPKEEQEAIVKNTKEGKPDETDDKIRDRLKKLHELKVRLKTSKGVDPLMLMMMKDDPVAMEKLKNTDVSEATAFVDEQIAHYKSKLKGGETDSGLGNKKTKTGADETEYTIGAVYEDANGRRAKYIGGTKKWEILP